VTAVCWHRAPKNSSATRMRKKVSKTNHEIELANWPAPGFEDTKLGVLMEPEVDHGASEVYAGVQA
jgi:hypothetical protein